MLTKPLNIVTLNQLASRFKTLIVQDDLDIQDDLMLQLINDSQLLGWPEFRATFPAEMGEDDYLDRASRSVGTPRFVKTWVPKMLARLQGGRN